MSEETKDQLPFGKQNYQLFGAAFIVVTIGYFLMLGGGSEDPTVFNREELFSTVRITIAPLVILLGLALGIYAIMKKSSS